MIQSLEANTSLWQYTKNRILRIVSAFWLSLFLASFILVPILSDTAVIFSFDAGSALYFFLKSAIFQVLGTAWQINGVFQNNPLMDNINGSMWILKYGIFLYFLLPVVLFFLHKKRQLVFLFAIILVLLSVAFLAGDFVLFTKPNIDEYSKNLFLSSYFFSGVSLYLYRDSIIFSKRIMFALGLLFVFGMFLSNLKLITLLVFPYLVVGFGSIIHTKWFSKTGDYSYGTYIYAFPVQQTLVHFFKDTINVLVLFTTSFIIKLILSILSWHLFEKKILRLKQKRKNIHV